MNLTHLLDRRFVGTLVVSGAAILLALGLGQGIRTGWLEPTSTPSTSAEPLRPQTPRAPYPWIERDAAFASESGGARLAGTLAIPAPATGPAVGHVSARLPAVVLVSGAGPQDRDGTFFGHKRFLVWTSALVGAGFAVLRLDDRGVGASEGVLLDADLSVLASDALAAVQWLQRQPEIEASQVGLLGVSLGGVVSALAAAEASDQAAVAFLILASTPGRPGAELLVAQQDRLLAAQGLPEVERQEMRMLTETAIRTARQGSGLTEAESRQQLRPLVRRMAELTSKLGGPLSLAPSESAIEQQIDLLLSPQMQDTLFLDPADALRRVRCPVLVVQGELDLQVDAGLNVPRLVEALGRASGPEAGRSGDEDRRGVEVRRFAGLNHLLQPAQTGLPSEYSEIEITLAPDMLDAVIAWLRATVTAVQEGPDV